MLLGVGYSATQIPLVTFASTDPAVAGFGLVAWLPASAANAAPEGKTATLVGLISLGRVAGAALGSATFAIVLATVGQRSGTSASLTAYLTVFAIVLTSSIVGGFLLLSARSPERAPAPPTPPQEANHA